MIGAGITIFQEITTGLILLSLAYCIRWFVQDKYNRPRAFLMIFWLTHALCFYAVLLMRKFGVLEVSPFSFTDWSSVLRFHTFLTIATIEVTRTIHKKFLNKLR